MKKYFQHSLYLFLLIVIIQCSKDENVVNPEPEESVVGISSLSFNTARQGEKVIAKGFGFNKFYSLYVFIQDEYVQSNTTSDSTISLFVPFAAESGVFEFYFRSAELDTLLISPEITITDMCEKSLCIDWNTKDTIVESDSWIRSWSCDASVMWSFKTSGDTLFIMRDDFCHDECHYWHTLVFRQNGNNELPEFLFTVYKKLEWTKPDIDDTLRNGVVRIDQWDSTSVYSGTYSYNEHNWIFWGSNEK